MPRLLLAVLLLAAASPVQAADGAKLFALQCRSCHGAASTPAGPALAGVAGARIAARKDFKYSAALAGKGGTWTDASLDAYLTAPGRFAPGGRMVTAIPSAENRQALVAYLKTLR